MKNITSLSTTGLNQHKKHSANYRLIIIMDKIPENIWDTFFCRRLLILTAVFMCPGKTELLALEVSPGVLLRVTADTGDKHFSEAAQALDPVGTAGHLVSIVVAYGIPNTPTALLANHMESALNVAVAQEGRRISSRTASVGTLRHALLTVRHTLSWNCLFIWLCSIHKHRWYYFLQGFHGSLKSS